MMRFARSGVVGFALLVGCGRTLVELGPGDSSGSGGNGASSGAMSGGVSGFSGAPSGGTSPGTGGSVAGASPVTTPTRCDDDHDGVLATRCGGTDCADQDPTIPRLNDWNATPIGTFTASTVALLQGASSLALGPDDIAHYAFVAPGQLRHLVQTSQTTWQTDLTVFGNLDTTSQVRMAVAPDGKARILYGGSGEPARLAYDRGESWGVMDVDPVGEPVAIAVSSSGVVHILYIVTEEWPESRLVYMTGDETALENGLPATILAHDAERAALAVDSYGSTHVVFQRNDGSFGYQVHSASGWHLERLPIAAEGPDAKLSSGGLAVDDAGVPRLAFVRNGELYYGERRGEWSVTPSTDVPLAVDAPYLAIDREGAVHILVPGYGEQSYIVGHDDVVGQLTVGIGGLPTGFAVDRAGAAHFSFQAGISTLGLGYATNRLIERDGVDRNCDLVDGIDQDRDGWASWVTGGGDCDDRTTASNPLGADLSGNGIDEDCDGRGACEPGLVGPTLVDVIYEEQGGGSFCIDATSVTNADYAAFLASDPSLPKGPPDGPYFCTSNSSAEPRPAGLAMGTNAPCPGFDPEGAPSEPVVCVDWCDAWTYCEWVGKRLCRDGSVDMAGVSEWRLGCPSVVSGVEHGIYEWQDDCSGSASESAACLVFASAGSEDAPASERCLPRAVSLPRDYWAGNLGFRCCTD